ncbi:serine/threonine protein kinase [Streptacidiphilus sp. EB103A]|uniref:protein kinase family protein n=1 Tax=Streptacidiphilus sp. EB103A TaxID=3156275 RepID=UPI0035116AF2
MADRSKAPVETIAESSADACPAEPTAELTAELTAEEIVGDISADDGSSGEQQAGDDQEGVEDTTVPDTPGDDATVALAPEAPTAPETPEDSESSAEPAGAAEPTETIEPAATVETAPLLPAPVRHSGDRIADRYRLEECLTQAGVFTSWRAVDEKLRRAVGIHLLASGHQRSKDAVAAARQAALLGDPRFVQVLDAVEEGELVYIIREWLPDATDLGTMLAEGPLEAYETYQMVRQVTDAIAAAHRRGMSHLRLTPSCVLRSDSGQYRINGLAMDAALHGLVPEDRASAELDDTRAIGTLLFASLTHRWPYPEDRHGLQGIPRTVGVVPPEQVKAGIHRGLSDLCSRVLCEHPVRHLEPLTSPQELAKAIAQLPRIKQPEPEPLVLPEYPATVYPRRDQGTTVPLPPRRPTAPLPPTPPPALPGRTGKALKWGISLVLLAAVGLGSWATAQALMDKPGTGNSQLPVNAGVGGATSAKPQTSSSSAAQHLLKITGAAEFSPLGAPIQADQVPLAIDGKASTAWTTSEYQNYPNFGNLSSRADGSGIIVDLGSAQSVSGVRLTLPVAGQTLEVLAAPADATSAPTSASSAYTQRIANLKTVGTTFDSALLATPVRTRYILIHITSLPPEPSNSAAYRGGISEIQIVG